MSTNQLADWLNLLHVPGIGPRVYLQLLAHFGYEPKRILSASAKELSCAGINPNIAYSLINSSSNAHIQDLTWLNSSPTHHIITLADPTYPPLLKEIADCPPVLFMVSNESTLPTYPAIAVVGSRKATKNGENTAFELSNSLSAYGITIVSGLAYGIDSCAHQGALAGKTSTLAVLAHGPDIVYPNPHKKLARIISQNGALISEFPPGTKPLAGFFPRRNRIISGLCLSLIHI